MTGALLQLVAKGVQMEHLIGNASSSYFHSVYRRRINFAIETVELYFRGNPDFGNKVDVELSDCPGDMLSSCGIAIDLPEVNFTTEGGWVNDIGHLLIKEISFEIGGRCIDKHFGVWMSIWNALTLPAEKKIAYNNLIGNVSVLTGTSLRLLQTSPIPKRRIYVPLQFWFNKNVSLAFPLLALQTDTSVNAGAKFVIQFEKANKLLRGDPINVNSLHLGDVRFSADNIFLSKKERLWFTKEDFEITITQLQLCSSTVKGRIQNTLLNSLNHPILELIWVFRDTDIENATGLSKSYIKFTDSDNGNPVDQAYLRINGIKRQKERRGAYYNKVTTLNTHTRSPDSSGILVMPFCTKPESFYEYTGSLNLTGLDDVVLTSILKPTASSKTNRLMIFARNYNILKFHDGFARLKYKI